MKKIHIFKGLITFSIKSLLLIIKFEDNNVAIIRSDLREKKNTKTL